MWSDQIKDKIEARENMESTNLLYFLVFCNVNVK